MKLREYRILCGLKQTDAAKALGVSEGAYSRYEHGTRTPRPKMAKKIASLFGFDWTEFYKEGDEDDKVPDHPAGG